MEMMEEKLLSAGLHLGKDLSTRREEGVQKPENFADVLYVWSLKVP